MTAVNFKDAAVAVKDPANQLNTGRVSHRTERRGLFNFVSDAQWAADNLLGAGAFPLAKASFFANRDHFRLEPGDPFLLHLPERGIEHKAFRVATLTEEAPEDEWIRVDAVEDPLYLATFAAIGGDLFPVQRGGSAAQFWELLPLSSVAVAEAPYALAGPAIRVLPMPSREVLREVGFNFYLSLDGSTYRRVAEPSGYAVHGELAEPYSADTYAIDDSSEGLLVDFFNTDVGRIQTVTRAEMFTRNLALVGSEIVSFQTITPVSGNTYRLTGIVRGRYDTRPTAHAAETSLVWLGSLWSLADGDLLPGTTRHFKAVPFTANSVGDISQAEAVELMLTGRALTPYMPVNFLANGGAFRPAYSSDVTLTWWPRVRGEGAGLGDADTVVDAAPSWEGLFEVRVYVGGLLVRTQSAIDAASWTYSEADNLADNGALADEILFSLTNYRAEGGITYTSPAAVVSVFKEV